MLIAEDVLPDILKRLPVKATCRFRCVCKSWNSLLSSPFFANHRLASTAAFRAADADAAASLITFNQLRIRCALHRPQDDPDAVPPLLHLPFRPHLSHTLTCVSGVIHGVACLYYTRVGFTNHIVLWNPAIRKHLPIPLPVHVKAIEPVLGFDARRNDFKLVSMVVDGDYCEVFSVRDSLWRRKRLPTGCHSKMKWMAEGCFVDGSIYWNTYVEGRSHGPLLEFDCESEEFKIVEPPRGVRGVSVLAWCGLLLVPNLVSPLIPQNTICEVWAMHKDGEGGVIWRQLRHTDGDIVAQRFRLTPYGKVGLQFRCMASLHKTVWDFKESMLLMDIGKPCCEGDRA